MAHAVWPEPVMWVQATIPTPTIPDTSTADDLGAACLGSSGGCSLTCDPKDTWNVLSATSAGAANLVHIGDPSPARPTEVGDGKYHLFVGVPHQSGKEPMVRTHEATASNAGGPYTLSSKPIMDTTDTYDTYGLEPPSYLRADVSGPAGKLRRPRGPKPECPRCAPPQRPRRSSLWFMAQLSGFQRSHASKTAPGYQIPPRLYLYPPTLAPAQGGLCGKHCQC